MSEQLPQSNPNYDHLFAVPTQAELLAGLTATNEVAHSKRLELLFAPRVARDEVQDNRIAEDFDFAHLFEQDDQTAEELRVRAAGLTALRTVEYERAAVVTSDMKDAAWTRVSEARRDPIADAIIAKYENTSLPSDKHSVVDTLRTTSALRYELGSYYLRDKLPTMIERLPSQVAADDQKVPSHVGYDHIPNLRSQEYAAMLTLSMLDGTFEDPGADTIKLDASGGVELGQHKAVANMLIAG
jgi:hypothetical protein